MSNYKVEEFYGKDNVKLALHVWEGAEKPKGVVQLSHGMAEHAARYAEFAEFLCANGFAVFADDHRGHGLSPVTYGDIFNDTVQDMVLITRYIKTLYPDLPVFLFGHSYGSFLAQTYIQRAGAEIAGAVLCGTTVASGLNGLFARILPWFGEKFFGAEADANLIRKMTFEKYCKYFKDGREKLPEGVKNVWLTRDLEEVKSYDADPMCGFTMSYGFYRSMFRGMRESYKAENMSSTRKDLPIFLIAGDKDAVGDFGRLTNKLYDIYTGVALKCASVKIYPEARHALLSELNRAEVMDDIRRFFYEQI